MPVTPARPSMFDLPTTANSPTPDDFYRVLVQIANNLDTIGTTARTIGRFAPWVIAALATWIGASPTVVHAILANVPNATP